MGTNVTKNIKVGCYSMNKVKTVGASCNTQMKLQACKQWLSSSKKNKNRWISKVSVAWSKVLESLVKPVILIWLSAMSTIKLDSEAASCLYFY